MKKGKIILIEGTDKSGKQTQSKRLVKRLRRKNIPVETISFPKYKTPTGRIIGQCYFREKKAQMKIIIGKEILPGLEMQMQLIHILPHYIFTADRLAAQEEIVDSAEELVDVQAKALDDLRDALAERKAVVEKEVDILQDELKIRQDALTDTREATQEKLDLLREEKDTRQQAWDDEIEIIQDRLDDARDQAAAIADMPIPELPDVAGSWQEINDELEKQFEELQGTNRGIT